VRQAGVGALSPQLIPTDEQSGFVDAHRDDGKRFVARADEKLTAFAEPESAIRLPGGISSRRSCQGGVELRNGDGAARGAAVGDAGRREAD
jgi:hypothetical protein